MKIQKFLLITFVLFPFFGLAQTPDFKGVWVRTERISLSGADYGNGVPTKLDILIKGNVLTLASTNITGVAAHPDTTTTEIFYTDGKPSSYVSGTKRTRSTIVKWSPDHLTATVTTKASAKDQPSTIEIISEDQWTLSADGKTLTILRTFTSLINADDKWAMKGIYTKQ